jgi:hypothetical protein
MHGMKLPEGLKESQKLPEPVFTPSTKAEAGQHDENIHPDEGQSYLLIMDLLLIINLSQETGRPCHIRTYIFCCPGTIHSCG